MLEKILLQNGFTDKEAKIYLAVLAAGETTVAHAASKAGVERTTVYGLLEKMQKDALLSVTKRKGIQYISAMPPRVLIDRFKKSAHLAEQALPELLELAYSSPLKPVMRFLDGMEGVKQTLREFTLGTQEKMLFTDYSKMPADLQQFIVKEIAPINRRMGQPRCIAVRNPENELIIREHMDKLSTHRLIDFPERSQELELLLFDGSKSAFISFAPEEQFSVIIDSPAIYRMLRNFFLFAWDSAKPH